MILDGRPPRTSRARRSGSSCCSRWPRRSACSGPSASTHRSCGRLRLRLRPRDADRRTRHRLADALPRRSRVPRQVRPRRPAPGGGPLRDPRRRPRRDRDAARPHRPPDDGEHRLPARRRRVHQRRPRARAACFAEVRSVDADTAEEVLAAMIDALHDGAAHGECDVDVMTEKQVVGYRVKPSSPAVVAAEAALRAHGYEPRRIATGGASDANVLEAAGIPTRQRGQRHRAQPRADRARLGRRAGLDARRSVLPPRRSGGGMSSELRAHRLRDPVRRQVHLRPRATPSATRTARSSSASSSRHPGAVGVVVLDDDDALARPPAPRGDRRAGPARDPRRQAGRRGRGPARGRPSRARRGDRQAGRPLGLARRLLHLRRASPTRSSTSSSPPASPMSTSAPRSRRTSASTSSCARSPTSTRSSPRRWTPRR